MVFELDTETAAQSALRNPETARIASALLAEDGRPEVSREGLDEAMGRLEQAWKRARRLALGREIRELGLSETDPRTLEYLQLVQELRPGCEGR
jgi:hypothetical protein